VLEDGVLVSCSYAPSSEVPVPYNIVPEGSTGAHLGATRKYINYARVAKVKRLQAQACNYGRDLQLCETTISKANDLLQDIGRGTASEISAVAAALVLGARIAAFPVSIQDVCLRLEVPMSDFRHSFASMQRHIEEPIPSMQVWSAMFISVSSIACFTLTN
jgi:hypothetical protein